MVKTMVDSKDKTLAFLRSHLAVAVTLTAAITTALSAIGFNIVTPQAQIREGLATQAALVATQAGVVAQLNEKVDALERYGSQPMQLLIRMTCLNSDPQIQRDLAVGSLSCATYMGGVSARALGSGRGSH
jgi:hypothetical protein